jgi:hypothetical protein
VLNGARYATFAGHILYVAADSGVVVVDLDEPLRPRVLATVPLRDVRAMMLQFRYLFVVDGDGLDVVDVTHPEQAHVVMVRPCLSPTRVASLSLELCLRGGGSWRLGHRRRCAA